MPIRYTHTRVIPYAISLAALLIIPGAFAFAAGPSGVVVDATGKPAANVQVFLEPSLADPLMETRTDANGAFQFEDPVAEGAGVFTLAANSAFSGRGIQAADLAPGGRIELRLTEPASLDLTVVDEKGKPVQGACVTRIGLLSANKVGIPLGKLRDIGIDLPTSNDAGQVTIPRLPAGGRISLKVTHPQFAQEAVDDVAVGTAGQRVKMSHGVWVRGTVRARTENLPVAKAAILIRNGQPPYETVLAWTNGEGEFTVRLKPGAYACQAAGAVYRSSGWLPLSVGVGAEEQSFSMTVTGAGAIQGRVQDAVSEKPVAGARLIVKTNGHLACALHTDADGRFQAPVAEGDTIIRLETMPGYYAPELPEQRFAVQEGKTVDVPVFWVNPIPSYTVRIVNNDMQPVPGAIVQMLRPQQFGWSVTDAQGAVPVHLASLPADGWIVGMVEDATQPLAALFALRRDNAGGATVQLLPTGQITGRVADGKGQPLEGVVVSALFGEGLLPEPLCVWRTLSGPDGKFQWPGMAAQTPIRCVAAMSAGSASGESKVLMVEANATADTGDIVIEGGTGSGSELGKSFRWHDERLLAGPKLDKKDRKDRPAWVMYCRPDEAAMTIEALTAAKNILNHRDMLFCVVVRGTAECPAAPFPVYAADPPGKATTYLIDRSGNVVFEALGMPPAFIAAKL